MSAWNIEQDTAAQLPIALSERMLSREAAPARMPHGDNDNFLSRHLIEDQVGVGQRHDTAQTAFAGELAGAGILHQEGVIACMRA